MKARTKIQKLMVITNDSTFSFNNAQATLLGMGFFWCGSPALAVKHTDKLYIIVYSDGKLHWSNSFKNKKGLPVYAASDVGGWAPIAQDVVSDWFPPIVVKEADGVKSYVVKINDVRDNVFITNGIEVVDLSISVIRAILDKLDSLRSGEPELCLPRQLFGHDVSYTPNGIVIDDCRVIGYDKVKALYSDMLTMINDDQDDSPVGDDDDINDDDDGDASWFDDDAGDEDND